MSSTLEGMLDHAVQTDVSAGRPARLDALSRLYIEGSADYPVPERYRSLPEGFTEMDGDEDLHVFVKRINGARCMITRLQDDFEGWERELARCWLAVMILALAAFALAGYAFMARALGPLERLTDRTALMQRALQSGRMYEADAFDGPWPGNEIGRLAETLRGFATRLRTIVLREKQFAGEVSHELRTPLSIVSMSLELLAEGELSDKQRRNAERGLAAVARMQEQIKVFLSLVRSQGLQGAEQATLGEITSSLLAQWRQLAEGKALAVEVLGEAPAARYNAVLAEAVIGNLVANAIRYTPQGRVRVVFGEGGVAVEDTGPGISEADRERIFDEGYRGEAAARGGAGYGIGLAVARHAADVLGWTIGLESSPAGTRFTVRL
ncbi:MAG: HAMP domain-containing histidine kinase [Duodenibacillus sp.]|nr:HAMP domain-containing histidine kinase [Duodenibacillus sp.]